METKSYRVYPYRWVVLGVFMFINLMMQLMWITYAPVTGVAATYYHVNDLKIGFLAIAPRGQGSSPGGLRAVLVLAPPS